MKWICQAAGNFPPPAGVEPHHDPFRLALLRRHLLPRLPRLRRKGRGQSRAADRRRRRTGGDRPRRAGAGVAGHDGGEFAPLAGLSGRLRFADRVARVDAMAAGRAAGPPAHRFRRATARAAGRQAGRGVLDDPLTDEARPHHPSAGQRRDTHRHVRPFPAAERGGFLAAGDPMGVGGLFFTAAGSVVGSAAARRRGGVAAAIGQVAKARARGGRRHPPSRP